jgi:hypothetical protein
VLGSFARLNKAVSDLGGKTGAGMMAANCVVFAMSMMTRKVLPNG